MTGIVTFANTKPAPFAMTTRPSWCNNCGEMVDAFHFDEMTTEPGAVRTWYCSRCNADLAVEPIESQPLAPGGDVQVAAAARSLAHLEWGATLAVVLTPAIAITDTWAVLLPFLLASTIVLALLSVRACWVIDRAFGGLES